MPIKFMDDPEEFERITGGYRGSAYIGPAPVRRPKRQEVFLCPRITEQPEITRPSLRCLRQDVGLTMTDSHEI